MEELEAMEEDGRMAALPKKEQILLRKKLGKLRANLDGVRKMMQTPQAIFVVDTKREEIAVAEAERLGIPVIGILDTNADPDEVLYGIPGNDDAIRSVSLISEVIADAVIAGATAEAITEAEMITAEAAGEPAAVPDTEAAVGSEPAEAASEASEETVAAATIAETPAEVAAEAEDAVEGTEAE
jgi:small subunit ribosomal protein S2